MFGHQQAVRRQKMKTNIITINSSGEGILDALRETEKAAAYNELTKKETLRLRLLAEEMTGMFCTIIPVKTASYWVEADGKSYSLHLATKTRMNADLREELLSTSTSGKNAAAKGFMGKLRDLFMQMGEYDDYGIPPRMMYGFPDMDCETFETPSAAMLGGMMYNWSLKEYRSAIEERKEQEAEQWDELEKSITAKLADEIKIFINGDNVEMEIDKAF